MNLTRVHVNAVQAPCVVGLTWILRDSQGEELDVLDSAAEFFIGEAVHDHHDHDHDHDHHGQSDSHGHSHHSAHSHAPETDLLPKLQAALLGLTQGASVDVHLEPEDAFGDFDESLIHLEARSLFGADLEVGLCFEGLPQGCKGNAEGADPHAVYCVTDIYPEHVVLDGNHPLAGLSLRVSLKIEYIRAATQEELAKQSAGVGFFKLGNDAVH